MAMEKKKNFGRTLLWARGVLSLEWLPQLNTFVCQAEAKARLKVARKVSQEAAEEAGSSDSNLHPLATSTIRVHTPQKSTTCSAP